MRIAGWAGLAGAALAVLLLFGWRNRVNDRRAAELHAAIDAATATADSLRGAFAGQRATTDTLWRVRWLPARAAVDSALRDTSRRDVPDSLVLPFVLAADTVRLTCERSVVTCDALVKAERSRADSALLLAEHWRHGPRMVREAFVATDLSGRWYAGTRAQVRLFGVRLFGQAATRIDSAPALALRVGATVRF